MSRRRFLQRTGALASLAAVAPARPSAEAGPGGLALVSDPGDPIASSEPARWAVDLLVQECTSRGLPVRLRPRLGDVGPDEECLLVAGRAAGTARELLGRKADLLDAPGSFVLTSGRWGKRAILLAAAPDGPGLAYALTDLVDRMESGIEPRQALTPRAETLGRPFNRIRGVMRVFASDVEDLGWFHDHGFWERYLTMLVRHRFNRFHLALGLGYDFARQLRDTYFYFAYPFLVAVPGYDVRAVPLSDAERDRNLESLRFASRAARRRGLHFQLGLWTHAFQWTDSPDANYTIAGLASESHAAYCRDALATLLEACPDIDGVTLRTHGESGVPEADVGRRQFWRTVIDGVARCRRPVEIDLHAKGVDEEIIETARAAGRPLRVSPKFWAEHMGLPYLQSSIREFELPREPASGETLMAISTGARNHMRYSYGDLLRADRRYGILHRVWPGTQRLLLWGDPAYAAGYARAFGALDADGLELMEPLSFKGRKGSGLAGGRDACADPSLRPAGGDWTKYEYTYRLWGRLGYDPDADPDEWRRRLRHEFGAAADAVESGLAKASRILPLITTAYCPSAANNNYWPEIHTSMSLLDATQPAFHDTPVPRVFGAVTSLDPQLFASVNEAVGSLLAEEPVEKLTPLEVAGQLEAWAEGSAADLSAADARIPRRSDPAYRRVVIDCAIACGTGRFFAHKLRAAVLFGVFDRSGDERARGAALAAYRRARQAWTDLVARSEGAYVADITFGLDAHLRGHWRDRLGAIDRDIAALEAWTPARTGGFDAAAVAAALEAVQAPRPRPVLAVVHTPVARFGRGRPILVEAGASPEAVSVRLWYRRLNQAETYRRLDLRREGASWRGEVPGAYTDSPYPVQYYLALRSAGGVTLHPGFRPEFLGQPYFVVQPG